MATKVHHQMVALSLLIFCAPSCCSVTVEVKLNTSKLLNTVNEHFVSFTLSMSDLKDHFKEHNISNPIVSQLAHVFSPGVVRVGGTFADSVVFNPNASRYQLLKVEQTTNTLTSFDWKVFNDFAESSGLQLLFDLNNQLRYEGQWDPTNAELLFEETISKGYNPVWWQLGNEPNLYPEHNVTVVTPEQLAGDYARLRAVLQKYPRAGNVVIGPELTRPYDKRVATFMEDFLGNLTKYGQGILNAVSWHHYYFSGKTATVAEFMDPTVLDQLIQQISTYQSSVTRHVPGTPLWLTETASAYDGGAPKISDTYVAGFLWADELGIAAAMKVELVCKQALLAGAYRLLSLDLKPVPVYWLSLLHKQLVGEKVLAVENGLVPGRTTRIYSHCTGTPKIKLTPVYQPGAVVLMVDNLRNESVIVSTPQLQGVRHLYLLTPSNGNISSTDIYLNEVKLEFDGKFPHLEPKVFTTDVTFPQNTYGFVVYPEAKLKICM